MSAKSDPRGQFRVFWRWKWLFLVVLIGVPVGVYLVVSRQAKVYQSSVLLKEDALPTDTSIFNNGQAPLQSGAPDPVTLGGEARVVTTAPVAKLAARHLHPRPSNPISLLNGITASADQNTGFITVTASASSPRRAARVANAFGKAVVKLRTDEAIGLLTRAIDQMSAEPRR